MGLAITVGALVEYADDEEYVGWLKKDIDKIGALLIQVGLRRHQEPIVFRDANPVSFEMWGYSGLHNLRRLAAYVRAGFSLTPLQSEESASTDPILLSYSNLSDDIIDRPGVVLFNSPDAEGPNFDHLVHHSDCDGYYIPIDFDAVIVALGDEAERTEYIGSSYALLRECKELARAIDLPLDLDPEKKEVWNAAEGPDETSGNWRRFGVEAFTCLRLYRAAEASIHMQSTLVFH